MNIAAAQAEMRTIYRGGFVGQAVSGLIWLASALIATLVNPQVGAIALFVGGIFIFPLTQLGLLLARQPATLSSGNPLQGLAKQIAFIVPVCLPVVFAAMQGNLNWYYPAFMIVVGAHYMPFIFLYGMKRYGILAAVLIAAGILIGWMLPNQFTAGGWLTAAVLLIFALVTAITFTRSNASPA